MKQILLTLVAGVFFYTSYAQTSDSQQKKGGSDGGENLVKINLTSLPLKNYSFQYERAIGRKISIGAGYRFMPKSGDSFKISS